MDRMVKKTFFQSPGLAILFINSGQKSSPPIRVKPLCGIDLVDATFLRRSHDDIRIKINPETNQSYEG